MKIPEWPIITVEGEYHEHCIAVLQAMVDMYDISKEEAIGRINCFLQGQNMNDDMFTHDFPDTWAKCSRLAGRFPKCDVDRGGTVFTEAEIAAGRGAGPA